MQLAIPLNKPFFQFPKLPKHWSLARISHTAASTVGILAVVGTIGIFAGPPAYRAITGNGGNSSGPGLTTWITANLFIDTTTGDNSCIRSASLVVYDSTKACSSMQAAQTVANAGDRIVLKCGSGFATQNYSAQSISSNGKATVVDYYAERYIQAASAVDVLTATTCVTEDSLSISVDKVHVHGIQAATQGFVNGGQTMATLTTLSVSGSQTDDLVDGWRGHAVVMAGQGITFSHMEIGNANYCSPTAQERDAMTMTPFVVAAPNNTGITDSVLHDWYDGSVAPDGACGQPSNLGGHDDCISSNGGNNQTIARNLFYKCGSSSILQWGEFSGGAMGSIKVENNYFGPKPTEFNVLSMGQGNCSGLVIRNNVFVGGSFDNDGGCTGVSPKIDNNVILDAVGSCSSGSGLGFVGDHNIFPVSGGAICGTNAKRCAPSWSHGSPSGFNYWQPGLNSSDTCAKAYATTDIPSTDFYSVGRSNPAAAGMVEPDGSLTLANLWINTTVGVSPSRCSPPCSYDPTHAYGSFQAAYDASASGGDTIGIQPGNYGNGSDVNILENGHSQAGPMTTFQCTVAHACTIVGGALQLGRHAIGADAPSYLSFNGIDIKNGQFTSLPDNGQAQPTDVTFQNGHIYSWGDHGSLVWLSEYKNFTLRNVELGPSCCGGNGNGGDGIESGILPSSGIGDINWLIDNVHIHDIYDTCTAATSAMISLYGACSGSGFGDPGGSAQDHVDGIQLWGGVAGLTVQNSLINNVDQTGGTAGQSFFIECSTGCIGYNNITLVNNMIGNSVNHDTTLGANCNTGCITGFVHIYYNTFQGRFNFASTTSNRSFANSISIVLAGNIIGNTLSGCTVWTPAGTLTPTWTHNKIATGACGGTDISGSPTYVNTSAATLDLHLSGAQNAINGGEATFCPGTDFDGSIRPINGICDIGADEAG